MGCFGDMEATKQTTTNTKSTVSPPKWVETAGRENYNLARSILDKGYVPYTGTRVAPLTQDEISAGNLIRSTPTSNPYEGQAANLLNLYGTTPGYQYDFNTIVDENGPLGSIQNYINPYVQNVLDPILREIGFSGAKQRNDIGASAIMSGAFGDARHGVAEGEQFKNELLATGDATGKAWADAFNTALGLRQSDAARQFATQQAQAGENQSALDRARTSSIDLTNLDQYGVSRALGLSSALGGYGALERDLAQKQADVDYDTFRQQNGGFDRDMISWLTTLLAGTPTSKTTEGTGTQTVEQPNNSGWQAVGTLASALLL